MSWFKKKIAAKPGGLAAQLGSDFILNAIDDGVIVVDDKQTINLLNPVACNLLGWEAKDAIGLDWRSVIKFLDEKGESVGDRAPLEQAFRQGKPVRDNSALLRTKSDASITIDISVSPLVDDKNHITGAIGVFRDVSAERAEEAKRADFISTASHEMRTPVAAIEGYLSLALNDKVATVDGRARDYLEKARTATKHLGELFQDLLASAKAEDGRITNHPEVIEMGELMQQLATDLQFAAQKKRLEMEFLIGETSVLNSSIIDASHPNHASQKVIRPFYYVNADPERLREVITNLFDNACKYTDTGKISLGLTGDLNTIQLYVRDTGHGIPAADIPHLFQKFYRVDNSDTRTIGGTGLGLFICRKIVELYNGKIWVESQVGKGSTFYINLPRLSDDQAEQLKKSAGSTVAPILTEQEAMPTTPSDVQLKT